MSSDINVQTFSGKVNITSNLLVGNSHLFVDTTNNRVGLVTVNPDAGLHVNSNAYVDTDFRVGPSIVMNETSGQITAGSFVGDGSALQGINSDSGSWVNGTDVVHLATIGDKVGIGVVDPQYKLDVDGDINIPTGSTLRINGTPAVFSNWDVSGSDISRSSGNVGIGTTTPGSTLTVGDGVFPTSGEAVGSITVTGTGSTKSLPGKPGIYHRAGVGLGLWSDAHMSMEVDGTNGIIEAMRIKNNGNVGIGTTSPNVPLEVNGDFLVAANSGAWSSTAGKGIYMRYSTNGSQDSTYIQSIDRSTGTQYPMTLEASSFYLKNGNVGIGTDDPDGTLHVQTDNRVHITAGTVPAFTGMHTTSTATGRAQLVLSSHYSDLVIASSQINNNHGSTLSFATVNPSNTAEYRKFVINQGNWGSRKDFLDFGLSASAADQNPHSSITSTDTVLTLDGNNKRVGIGTSDPDSKLHIYESTGTSHGIQVGTLILEHGNIGGSSSIVFPSKVNITSDYGYITYNENYGEAGTSPATENGVLLLGAENDGTGSSDHVRIKTRLVVEADMVSTDPTYAFQVKSSNTTSDLFAVHRGGSIGINGNDSNVPFTIQTNKTITVDGTSYNSYCRWYRGSGGWYIGSDDATDWNQNLYWFSYINATGNPLRKVIQFENDQSKGINLNANTFTGQHRNRVKGVNPTNIETFIGLIVSADNNENIKVNGGVERGLDAITINETIPLVSVTNKAYDKSVFGVVSGSEDPESREDKFGRVTSVFIKEEGDDRIFINSLGEGAMWISNQNGPLTSGDYVTSSHIPGYGMKQDSEFLANYTVAKITMNCDFQVTPRIKYKIKSEFKTVNYYRHEDNFIKEPEYTKLDADVQAVYTREQYDENVNILDEHGQLQWEDSGETEAPYKLRYLLPDGAQISEEEYTKRALANEEVYLAAFVGCTYHCG